MPIEPGATYVLPSGLLRLRSVGKLDAAGCQIVTRFKSNTAIWKNWLSPVAARSSPTASAFCRCGKRAAAAIRCRTRYERCGLQPTPEGAGASSKDLDSDRRSLPPGGPCAVSFPDPRSLGTSENQFAPDCHRTHRFLLLRLAQAAQKHIPSPIVFSRLIRANHAPPSHQLLAHRLDFKISDR